MQLYPLKSVRGPRRFVLMTGLLAAALMAASAHFAVAGGANGSSPACRGETDGSGTVLGVSRIVEIDASHGPIFGAMTTQAREPSFLKPKEVVLTFDDGPMPWITKSILDTLDAQCTKATFFSVGRMALAYPATVKDVVTRGHTLGTHTYSHPFNMPRMKLESAATEIERGIAAVSAAAGTPIAPFFRFTGLSDSARLLGYLQTRGIAAFSVDVVSNDSYIGNPDTLADRTMAEIEKTKGGIVLFHDIKSSTAKALPIILRRLKAKGYSIVHMTANGVSQPLPEATDFVTPKLAKTNTGKELLPFYGAAGPDRPAHQTLPPSAVIAPALRDRSTQHKAVRHTNSRDLKRSVDDNAAQSIVIEADAGLSAVGDWITDVVPKSSPAKHPSVRQRDAR